MHNSLWTKYTVIGESLVPNSTERSDSYGLLSYPRIFHLHHPLPSVIRGRRTGYRILEGIHRDSTPALGRRRFLLRPDPRAYILSFA